MSDGLISRQDVIDALRALEDTGKLNNDISLWDAVNIIEERILAKYPNTDNTLIEELIIEELIRTAREQYCSTLAKTIIL